jgi:hypothetical protein
LCFTANHIGFHRLALYEIIEMRLGTTVFPDRGAMRTAGAEVIEN